MKKRDIIIVSLIVTILLTAAIAISLKLKKKDYPKIAYINNVSYYGTGKKCKVVPKKMVDGTIETFIDPQIMPDMPNSANFGAEYEALGYMFLDDGQLIVQIGEDWYYFDRK